MVNSSYDGSMHNVHARDYEYSVKINRWFLEPIGAWPKFTKPNKLKRFLAKLLNFTCHSLIIFTITPCALFILFEDTSMEARIQAIGPMSNFLMGELNYCFLLMRSNEIVHCIDHVKRDWEMVKKASDREVMLKNAKVGRFIACVAALCMNIGIFSYNIITGFQKNVYYIGNESCSMYRLPCPFHTELLDTRFSPTNEIIFAVQLLSGFVVNSATVGACGLAAVLAMHACGQLSVAMSSLNYLINTGQEDEKVALRKIGVIVDHHLRTLSFVWYIEKVMNLICLVELVGCTFNMCMLEYYIVTEKSKETLATYALVYASMIFNIFIFCYIGEAITEQCKKVGEEVYMTKWYRLPPKAAISLVMIISRSNTMIKLSAGKFIHISIATFGDVFKTSFAYFNMLRTVAM